jgi:hypothetical protein
VTLEAVIFCHLTGLRAVPVWLGNHGRVGVIFPEGNQLNQGQQDESGQNHVPKFLLHLHSPVQKKGLGALKILHPFALKNLTLILV